MVFPTKFFRFSVASLKFGGFMALSLSESDTTGGRCLHRTGSISSQRDVEVKSSLFTMMSLRASLQVLFLLPLLRSFIISGDVGLVFHPHPLEVISITRSMSRCDVVFLAISRIAEHYTVFSLVIHRGPPDFAEQMVDFQRWNLPMQQRPPRKPPWNQHITADIGDVTRMRITRTHQQHVWVYGTITTTYVSIFRRVSTSKVLRCNGWIADFAFRKRKRWYIDKNQMFPKLESHTRLTDKMRAIKHIIRIAEPKLYCFFITKICDCIDIPMFNITFFGSY